jgi:hypothetical protein
MKLKFKVKKRNRDECEHESGTIHSLGMSCEDAERMMKIFAMNENDPDHRALWHDSKNNPNLIMIEG